MSQQDRTHSAKRLIDELLRLYAPAQRHRRAYWNLICLVRERTTILEVPANPTRKSTLGLRWLIQGLSRIAKRRKHWIRRPETWQATSQSSYRDVRSLMRHLFERYPVPDFMAYCWIHPHLETWHEKLYVHMAEGRGVRQFANRPKIPISPKAARFFVKAPDNLSPTAALRYAQIRGLGCSKAFALNLVRFTQLDRVTSDERFWETVLQFLVRNQPQLLNNEELDIFWFLLHQKFRPGEETWGRGGGPDPLQPEFSLKGRTLKSLRRHMIHWREDVLRKRPELANKTQGWCRIDVAPLVQQDGDTKWLIFELLSDRALLLEGVAMNHCVESYVDACSVGHSSIWSLRIHRGGTPKRMATIEIDPRTRQVVQAKGKSNNPPTPEAKEVLQRWAEREGLELALYD